MSFTCDLSTNGLVPIVTDGMDTMYRPEGEDVTKLPSDHGMCMFNNVLFWNILERIVYNREWNYYTSGFRPLSPDALTELLNKTSNPNINIESDADYLSRMSRVIAHLLAKVNETIELMCFQEFPNGHTHPDGADPCFDEVCKMFTSAFPNFNLHIRGNNALMVRKDIHHTYLDDESYFTTMKSKIQAVVINKKLYLNVHLNWMGASDDKGNAEEYRAIATTINEILKDYNVEPVMLGDFNRENYDLLDTHHTVGIHRFAKELCETMYPGTDVSNNVYVLHTTNDFTNFRLVNAKDCVYTTSDYVIEF